MIILSGLFLINSQLSYASEPEFCKDYQSLSKKIDNIQEKTELINTAKECFDKLKDSKEYIILMAKLYLLDENYFYAKKILFEFYSKNMDCEIVSLIAYIDFMLNDKESVKESIKICSDTAILSKPLKTRYEILSALINNNKLDTPKMIYPEDQKLFSILNSKFKPVLSYRVKAKGGTGYTTNAFSSNPLDNTYEKDASSLLVDYNFGIEFGREISNKLYMTIDTEIKGTQFLNETGAFPPSDLSSYSLTLSPKVDYKFGSLLTTLRYRFDTLFLNIDTEYEKAPIQFFEGHRGEVFLNFSSKYTLFVGLGRRYFDEIARGRIETDGGFGYTKAFSENLSSIFLFTIRYYDASSRGYDDLGQSILLRLDYNIIQKLKISQYISLSFDNYLNSTGYFADGKTREDKLLRYNIEFQYTILQWLSSYISYTFSYRDSLIDSYNYYDHRLIAGLNLNLTSEKKRPDVFYQHNFEKTYYPIESSENNLQNLMNLLQENDSIQRGSQCRE